MNIPSKTTAGCRCLVSALQIQKKIPTAIVINFETSGYESVSEPPKKVSRTDSYEIEIATNEMSRDERRKKKKFLKMTARVTPVFCSSQKSLSVTTTFANKTHIFVKPLVVLDLNGIICHRVRKEQPLPHIQRICSVWSEDERDQNIRRMYRKSEGHIANTDIISRTDLTSFLMMLHDHFTVAIWSSAKRKTVLKIVRLLFPTHVSENLLFVWGQERCDSQINHLSGASDDEYRKGHYKGNVYVKNLGKVFAEYPLFDQTNTLLMDDSPSKMNPKYIQNCIHPYPIMGLDLDFLLQKVSSDLLDDSVLEMYNDKTNEEIQRTFFEQLIDFWSLPILCNESHDRKKYLGSDILQKFSSSMSWRNNTIS